MTYPNFPRSQKTGYLKNIPEGFFEKSLDQIIKNKNKQKETINRYFSLEHEKKSPSYLHSNDIVASHLNRCKERIDKPEEAPFHWAYTRDLIIKEEIEIKDVVLPPTMLVLNLESMMSCFIDISVTADFFAAMVRAVDDYLDQENDFKKYGDKMLIISHSYLDLMDMVLEDSLSKHPNASTYKRVIYQKMLELEKSLIHSEFENDPEKIVAHKSSGKALVDVFAPISSRKKHDLKEYRKFAQILGEAFQIMDDTIDYHEDSKKKGKNKNYLHLKGLKIQDGIAFASTKINAAIKMAKKMENDEALGLVWLSKQFNKVISSVVGKGRRMSLANYYSVFPLAFITLLMQACDGEQAAFHSW